MPAVARYTQRHESGALSTRLVRKGPNSLFLGQLRGKCVRDGIHEGLGVQVTVGRQFAAMDADGQVLRHFASLDGLNDCSNMGNESMYVHSRAA
jgi:hypothetical protein